MQVDKDGNVTDFYPRPHMEGDHSTMPITSNYRYFYPRPHMEGDEQRTELIALARDISTHALTWRATGRQNKGWMSCRISTHALTWRATDLRDL